MDPEQIFSLLMLIVAVLAVALVVGSVRSYCASFAPVLASLSVMSAHRGSGRWCGADVRRADLARDRDDAEQFVGGWRTHRQCTPPYRQPARSTERRLPGSSTGVPVVYKSAGSRLRPHAESMRLIPIISTAIITAKLRFIAGSIA